MAKNKITVFFNVHFFCRKGDSLGIPAGWLCYLAPEIIKSLHADQDHDEELPFSKASDVYAFGLVLAKKNHKFDGFLIKEKIEIFCI